MMTDIASTTAAAMVVGIVVVVVVVMPMTTVVEVCMCTETLPTSCPSYCDDSTSQVIFESGSVTISANLSST